MFKTMDDIKTANRFRGWYWFDESTMRFFDTRLSSKIYSDGDGGAYFVSSERGPRGFNEYRPARMYTVRHADKFGYVATIGEFQQYKTARQAHKAAADYAKNGHGDL